MSHAAFCLNTNGVRVHRFDAVWRAADGQGCFCTFFFNDTATTEIYTLSLHDALPIYIELNGAGWCGRADPYPGGVGHRRGERNRLPVDRRVYRGNHGGRKSTRLDSSHP